MVLVTLDVVAIVSYTKLNYSLHDVINFTNLDLFPFLSHRSPPPHSSSSLQNGCIKRILQE